MLLGGHAIVGVRLDSILHELAIEPWARFAVVCAADGYAERPLARAS